MPLRPPAGFIYPGYDPLKVADAPTIGTATGGDAQASVTFTAPTNVGGSAITSYTAVSDPSGISTSGASSPITVTGLSNGTSYTFRVWALNSYGPSPYSAASGSVTPDITPLAVFSGGYNSFSGLTVSAMLSVDISSTGNTTSFGTLSNTLRAASACASSTRGIVAGGGNSGVYYNNIDYVSVPAGGTCSDFGDLVQGVTDSTAAFNSTTIGVIGGYVSGSTFGNVIQYITIATTGNGTDFGDLTLVLAQLAGCSSSTRGVFLGGATTGFSASNVIQYVTIASAGNATDFGDLTQATRNSPAACSNATRGVIGGGQSASVYNTISYITIASAGDATYFGDLTTARAAIAAASSRTRAVWAGGNNGGTNYNILDYVTIASTGNATDFGDLNYPYTNTGMAGFGALNGGLQ